jgi:hypothetical protein
LSKNSVFTQKYIKLHKVDFHGDVINGAKSVISLHGIFFVQGYRPTRWIVMKDAVFDLLFSEMHTGNH